MKQRKAIFCPFELRKAKALFQKIVKIKTLNFSETKHFPAQSRGKGVDLVFKWI